MKVQFSPEGQTGDLGVRSKGQIYAIQKQFQRFILPNFACVLKNKIYKTFQRNFHFAAWVMPQGWDSGMLGVKNWRFVIAPHQLHLLVVFSDYTDLLFAL